jgi:hypothetical protein
LNVAVVDRETFLLVVDAFEAEVHSLKPGDASIELYVLNLRTTSNLWPVCRFRGI